MAIVLAGASISLASLLAAFQSAGYRLPQYFPMPPMMTLGHYLWAFVSAVLPLFFVLRSLRESVIRAESRLVALNQAQRELRASEARYRTVFENSTDALLIADATTGLIQDASPSAAALTGRRREELIGLHHSRLVPPEQAQEASALFARKLERPGLSEHELLHADGSRIPVETVSSRVTGANGEPLLLCACRDLRERRLAERTRRESESRFSTMFKSHGAMMLLIASDSGAIVDANAAAAAFYGYSPDQLRAMRHAELVAPANDGDAGRAKPAGNEQLEVACHRRASGEVRAVEIRSAPLELGGRSHEFLIIQDITERKRAEVGLHRLEAAVWQAAEAVYITDVRGNIEFVNPAFERITGYRPDEVLGRNPRILKSGHQDAAFYRGLWETILAGRAWSGVFVNRRKDGSLYHEAGSISPVKDENGRILHFVAVKNDVTREVELEQNLRQAQKMEAVGRLAGGIAHDFNNLLTVINGYCELLLARKPDADPERESLASIRQAGQRAAELTQQLLAFSRKQIVQVQSVGINAAIAEVLALVRPLIGENIRLTERLSPTAGSVLADRTQLDQVLMNLVLNARDAMPAGGSITIECAEAEVGAAEAERLQIAPGAYLRIEVSDTGVGIDAATRAHLFEPFYTTKAAGRGTGLGLATAYAIIGQCHGSITVESTPGHGSTFRILLPRSAAGPAGDEPAERAAVTGPATATILVVEDDSAVRELAASVLALPGYEILLAANAEQAEAIANDRRGPIDLLLTDVVMPGVDGNALATRLSARRAGMRVLFMSGYDRNMIAPEGILAQGVHYIGKPFTPEQLRSRVRELLNAEPHEKA
jgi:PAS domain S-box-containing protein